MVAHYLVALAILPAGLLDAVQHIESRGNPAAVSASGCVGLLQVCPRWSQFSAAQLRDPDVNRAEATRLLLGWHRRAHGDWSRALAAYRCGNRGLRGKCGQTYARRVLARARIHR